MSGFSVGRLDLSEGGFVPVFLTAFAVGEGLFTCFSCFLQAARSPTIFAVFPHWVPALLPRTKTWEHARVDLIVCVTRGGADFRALLTWGRLAPFAFGALATKGLEVEASGGV